MPEDGKMEEEKETKEKKGFFRRLVSGLGKTRESFVRGFDNIFSSHDRIDDDFWDDLEETMISGDMGECGNGRSKRVRAHSLHLPPAVSQLLSLPGPYRCA